MHTDDSRHATEFCRLEVWHLTQEVIRFHSIRGLEGDKKVAEKIARYLMFSILGIVMIAFAATMVLDDETVESVSGPAAGPLLSVKHGIFEVVGERTDSFVYWVRTTTHDIFTFSPSDRTPKVVMRMPPPPEIPAMETALPSSPPETMTDTSNEQMGRSIDATSEIVPPVPTESASDTTLADVSTNSPSIPVASEPTSLAATETESALTEQTPSPETIEATATPEAEPMLTDVANEPSDQAPAPPAMPATPVESAEAEPIAGDTPLESEPTETAAIAPDAAPPPPADPEAEKPGEADYQQGLRLYSGEGVDRNFGEAAQLFLKAAEAGHMEAQFNLGIMNFIGQTGGQDFANAAKWFERAANNGHAQAQYNLGFLYYEGKGVEQDLQTAFDWIARSADQGYAKAVKARDQFRQAMPEAFGG